MKFKCIKPYVSEFICLVFVFSVCLFSLVLGMIKNVIIISVKPHLLSISFLVLIIYIFVSAFSRPMILGITALYDFCFKKEKKDRFEIIKIFNYQSTGLTDKFNKNGDISAEERFLIMARKGTDIYRFYSAKYFDFAERETYEFRYAATSHIIIDYNSAALQ